MNFSRTLTNDFGLKLDKDAPNENNTIVFRLHACCERGKPRLTGIFLVSFGVHQLFLIINCSQQFSFLITNDECIIGDSVTSKALTWLPNGSEFPLVSDKSVSNSKPKTYTSFSCSQNTLSKEFSNNPIGPKDSDIILARLGPGQVTEP